MIRFEYEIEIKYFLYLERIIDKRIVDGVEKMVILCLLVFIIFIGLVSGLLMIICFVVGFVVIYRYLLLRLY